MNLELARAPNPRATHRDTLVIRRSLGGDEDQGAEVPTVVRDRRHRARCVPITRSASGTYGHSRAREEAAAATRTRAAGRSREEIREMYIAELRARNVKVPAEPVLDAAVDYITGNPLPAARVLGESLFQMGKGLYDISRPRGRHVKGGPAGRR